MTPGDVEQVRILCLNCGLVILPHSLVIGAAGLPRAFIIDFAVHFSDFVPVTELYFKIAFSFSVFCQCLRKFFVSFVSTLKAFYLEFVYFKTCLSLFPKPWKSVEMRIPI